MRFKYHMFRKIWRTNLAFWKHLKTESILNYMDSANNYGIVYKGEIYDNKPKLT